MATPNYILDYDHQRDEACRAISNRQSTLKILLKTKNDPELLRLWIDHHLEIVEPKDIVIFDNGSTDPRVEAIYKTRHPDIVVCRYSGFVDVIHHRKYNQVLFNALATSSLFHLFIDTDEFLVWSDGISYLRNRSIVDHLIPWSSEPVLPAVWLQNILGYWDRFFLGLDVGTLINGIRWGKPILNSSIKVPEITMHTTQVFGSQPYQYKITNFLLLHRSLLSVERRITANMYKLEAHGIVNDHKDLESAIALSDQTAIPENCRRYAREIRDLYKKPTGVRGSTDNSVLFREDGSLAFETLNNSKVFRMFIQNAQTA